MNKGRILDWFSKVTKLECFQDENCYVTSSNILHLIRIFRKNLSAFFALHICELKKLITVQFIYPHRPTCIISTSMYSNSLKFTGKTSQVFSSPCL